MEIKRTKLTELAEAMVDKLYEAGHRHPRFNGGFDVIGSKECWDCFNVLQFAEAAEKEAILITRANRRDPKIQPCEVCGEQHANYTCCDDCNYGKHICHFCGDHLGHTQVSVCYITEREAKKES